MTSKFLEDYKIAEPTIRKIYDSGLRVAILDALKDGPMRLADLKRRVNSNAPNTSSKAKELEGMGMVERSKGDYRLTPYGMAARARMEDSLEFYTTYEKFKEFWETHDTGGIPDFLWARLGELNNSYVFNNPPTNITAAHDTFVELLNSIKQVFYGVSPIYHDDYLTILLALRRKKVDVKIVVNSEILNLLINLKGNLKSELIALTDTGLWYLYDKDLTVAFTVSEKFLSMGLGLLSNPREYMNSDFRSTDPRAVQWGLDLFEYYKKQAKPVKLSDYL